MWTGLIAHTTGPISLHQPLVTRLIHSLAKAGQKPIIPFHLARSSFSVRLKPTTAIFNLPKKPYIIRRSSNISSEQTHLIAIWPGQNASYLPTNCRLHGTHAQRRVLQLSAGSAPLPSRNVRAQTKKEKTPDDKPMHDAAIRNQSYGSRPWPRPPPSRLPRLRFHDIFLERPQSWGNEEIRRPSIDSGIIPPERGPRADAAVKKSSRRCSSGHEPNCFRSSKLSGNTTPFFPATEISAFSVICGRAAPGTDFGFRPGNFWEPNATKKFKLPPHIRRPQRFCFVMATT